jgi:hypothetical protein
MVNQCCGEGAAVVFDCEKRGRRASGTGPAVLNPSSARRETQQAGLRLGEANMGVRVPPTHGRRLCCLHKNRSHHARII